MLRGHQNIENWLISYANNSVKIAVILIQIEEHDGGL